MPKNSRQVEAASYDNIALSLGADKMKTNWRLRSSYLPIVWIQVEAASYDNIALSLGTDSPADILFATDNVLEAEAAVAAGWQVQKAPRTNRLPCSHSEWPPSRLPHHHQCLRGGCMLADRPATMSLRAPGTCAASRCIAEW